MIASDRVFAGSIPEIYNRLMVPLLFDPYAAYLADRVVGLRPSDVLETAAGTGALTRAMASRLPAGARITATDLNQPMLDRAAATTPGSDRIRWQQADALALPFEDRSFDVVACQFGVMFFPDRILGYSEARRVLAPGGTFLFNVWDRLSENAFVTVVSATLAKLFPADPPTFMERLPHGYYDLAAIGADLKAAGFSSFGTETIGHVATAATPLDAATAYCQGSPLRTEIEARKNPSLQDATQAVADDLERAFGSGPIRGPIRAHLIAASH
ncbi:class I SAM-dependent methyltransferase [Mesorhizobium yinganensis]|uniref:class I SAM-dependent methyltransferase n=1 Tax=Mesorhizobium yinganensis TaxID=3157707 RepID=UPI0032B7E34A